MDCTNGKNKDENRIQQTITAELSVFHRTSLSRSHKVSKKTDQCGFSADNVSTDSPLLDTGRFIVASP
jgi:hypothetical protein